MTHPLLLSVLDAVEAREMRLLSWGIVDAALARPEVGALIDPLLDVHLSAGDHRFLDADQVIDAMVAATLLHATPQGGLRSRLAETTRLLQRLRQVFPHRNHPHRGDWQGAPTLVADFRIARRRRRYPRRDLAASRLLEALSSAGTPAATSAAVAALTQRDGEPMSLAGFQCRATLRILDGLRRGIQSATMVCAGTGSGKTMAFYVPVLSHVAQRVSPQDRSPWVKVVALYPRNELLKDQLAEVCAQARLLDTLQRERGARKLTVGAFFGPVPRDASDRALKEAQWQRGGDAYLCDYIRCPDGCAAPMRWLDADRSRGRQRLVCGSCDAVVGDDEVLLTRERIEREPPDVLFTTTEMLNRRLSDSRSRHLFGIGVVPGRAPQAVLLDEVHTYAGTHGAQVAYLLRRWRAGVRLPMTWVGLSATLRDASRFFQDLTGLAESEVAEVSPLAEEHEEEGAEYMLALRGDPASRTSLLSTTLQAAMLLARVQDHRDRPCSGGAYASRTFVFTDDIDVTNRLYFDLLDAEGRDSFGNVDGARPAGGLAVLRTPEPADLRRYLHGQDWQMAQDIGHDLSQRLTIGRTSSQDAGVDRGADVIVATASLEVGFNDPTVGAVLQHKAPRDVAQYLQRKGRAGRLRQTRPWTLVVLSDHGRDRVTYQNYQTLFDPLLPARLLPVRNRHVLRMQAVYAAMDHLSQRVHAPGSIWTALSGPQDFRTNRQLQQELAQVLRELLRDPAQTDALQRHLAQALQVDEEELEALLWGYPRPLLLAALPTALRRLDSEWLGAEGPRTDLVVPYHPLPDFVPSSLFSDLNLPEVVIDAPPQTSRGEREDHPMPLLQAMQQFAPGRVSRRFGIVHRHVRHWVAVPAGSAAQRVLDLAQVGSFTALSHFDLRSSDGSAQVIPVLLPRRLVVERPPAGLSDSANSQLDWHTQIVPPDVAVHLLTPGDVGGAAALAAIDVFSHQTLNPLEVRRFATGARARLQYQDGRDETVDVRFVRGAEDKAVAMGFSLLVDGICMRVRPVGALWSDAGGHATPTWRALRVQRYRDEIARGTALTAIDNDFLRMRLGDMFLTAACQRAYRSGLPLREAARAVAGDDALADLRALFDLIPQAAMPDGSGRSGRQERLRRDLETTLGQRSVRDELLRAAGLLWDPVDATWEPWLRRVYRDTLAAAVARAVVDSCPGVDETQLMIDTDPGPRAGHPGPVPDDEIWLTETTVGGAGIVEQFVARYAADPHRFAGLLDRALGTGEWEQIDAQMQRLVQALRDDAIPPLVDAVADFRTAGRSDEAAAAFARMRRLLAEHGFPPHHAFLSALVNRLLRPGSTPAADGFVGWALQEWRTAEATLGIELDLATIAPLLAADAQAQAVVDHLPPDPTADVHAWRTSVVSGLLWPRGAALRAGELAHWNPFRHPAVLERWLVRERLQPTQPRVLLADADWREQTLAALAREGSMTAVAAVDQREEAAAFCAFLAARPVEADDLLLYARARSVRFGDACIEIDADVAELAGGSTA